MGKAEKQNNESARRKRLDHKELTSSGFWVGHLMMILATIIGVYLAAAQGLEQAIRYNEYENVESNYHLRRSLYEEVSDNVKILRSFDLEYLSKNISDVSLIANRPVLGSYVWDAMKFSSSTLETPSYFLTAVRRFYHNSESILDRVTTRKLGWAHASKLLRAELEQMEKEVLPKLDENCQQLATILKQDFNLDITQP